MNTLAVGDLSNFMLERSLGFLSPHLQAEVLAAKANPAPSCGFQLSQPGGRRWEGEGRGRRGKEEEGRRTDGGNAHTWGSQAWSLPAWSPMLGENKV